MMNRFYPSFFLVTLLALWTFGLPRTTYAESETRPTPLPKGVLDVEIQKALPPGTPRVASNLPPLEMAPKHVFVDGGTVTTKAVLASEGFEGAFPSAAWTLLSLGNADAVWGRSTFRKSQGNASAWCAQSGADAPGPGQAVPDNMESWMIAGPFNLSSVTSGDISFDLYLDTEEGFDNMFVGASTDSTNFTLFGSSADTNGFERFSVDLENWGSLGDLTGRPQVWFAFIYVTDSSFTFEGAYVDQIALNVDTGSGLNLLINQIDAGDCPTLRAFVSVTDAQGNPVTGLQTSSFTVEENGILPTFTSQPATGSGAALATTFVLDGSDSLDPPDIANIQMAAKAFIDLLQPIDPVAVYHFGTDVELIRDYTTNRADAKAAIDALTDDLGSTSLYDAIVEAANHSLTIGGRRALLVMTDGMNNNSVASEQQAIAAAVAAGVPVFTIGFGNIDEDVLQRIADQTGGLFFRGASSSDLLTILTRISQTLGQQYVLTWPTSQIDGGSHTVNVTVRHQGLSTTRSATYSQASTPCASGSVCIESETVTCLNQNRFRVEVGWTDFTGNTGPGRVAPCGADDSGIFWFFAPDNWEMLVKVIDACTLNDRFWVFSAATTNVGYTLTVTDTHTGARKTYTNRLGVASPAVTDTSAFATCP